MTVHLLKLSVGTESLESLERWQERVLKERLRRGAPEVIAHVTRAYPKRAAEVLDGGSIYWVIKRMIVARQKIVGLEQVTTPGVNGDESEKPRCAIVLAPGLIPVRPVPKRPFQGWRHLEEKDAPADLVAGAVGESDELPPEMAAELRELGLL